MSVGQSVMAKVTRLSKCYASRQTYIEVNDTYSEGGTHEETLHPQSKARVMNKRQRGQGHNRMDCGFVRLTL